jgi:hypothetical protein
VEVGAMRFIQEFGYTVKVGQDEAHQKWTIENDARLRAAAPAGSKYLGTFAVVMGSEKQAGNYRFLMELDSYAALDTSAAVAKDPKSDWSKLLMESSRFIDLDLAAPWSNVLMKDVVDATIWDPKT